MPPACHRPVALFSGPVCSTTPPRYTVVDIRSDRNICPHPVFIPDVVLNHSFYKQSKTSNCEMLIKSYECLSLTPIVAGAN